MRLLVSLQQRKPTVPFSLVPTPFIECILQTTDDPKADQAIDELNKLRDVHCHLLTHFVAIKQQTEASASGIKSVLGDVQTHPAPRLSACQRGG
jgi:hypothetical protein